MTIVGLSDFHELRGCMGHLRYGIGCIKVALDLLQNQEQHWRGACPATPVYMSYPYAVPPGRSTRPVCRRGACTVLRRESVGPTDIGSAGPARSEGLRCLQTAQVQMRWTRGKLGVWPHLRLLGLTRCRPFRCQAVRALPDISEGCCSID